MDLPLEQLITPQGDAADLVAEADRYDAAITASRRSGHPDPGHRRQRPHRLQRAHLVPGLAHQGEDPGRGHPRGQCPVLSGGRRSAALPDPGAGDHPRSEAGRACGHGREQGRRRPGHGGGACQRHTAPPRCCSFTAGPWSSWTLRQRRGCACWTTTGRPRSSTTSWAKRPRGRGCSSRRSSRAEPLSGRSDAGDHRGGPGHDVPRPAVVGIQPRSQAAPRSSGTASADVMTAVDCARFWPTP